MVALFIWLPHYVGFLSFPTPSHIHRETMRGVALGSDTSQSY
jgi:hypothetical protein